MKKAWAILLSFALVSVIRAQDTGTIVHGQLKDGATGDNLINATIQLIRTKDSVAVRQTISNKNGFFINRVPLGKYFLQPSYIGYKDTTYSITIGSKDSIYNAGVLMMKKSEAELMEVVIKSTIPPVITKSDTIVYNADAFKTSPNATVEELLKKLPGMEVDKDGNISFQGKKIQKIYVDGKELLFNDPRLTTKNFLADMVQKVEAFDEKSERAKLTGIPDDNPGKALNLRLKPDKKKGYFGNIETGYAGLNRFNIAASANYLKGDAFATIGTGYNNSGSNRVNNQAKYISLNYQNTLIQNLQISLSYGGNMNNSRSWSYNQRQTFMADSSLSQEKETTAASESNSQNLNMGINYKPDSFSNLNITSSFGLQFIKNNTGDMADSHIEKAGNMQPVNSALTNNKANENRWNGSINLSYNRRSRKQGRYFGLRINSSRNQQNGNRGLASLTKFYDHFSMPVDSLEKNNRSYENSRTVKFGLGIAYTEPVGKGQVLDFYYNMNSSNSENNRQTHNYNPITDKYDDPDSTSSNNFENIQGEQSFGIGYNNFSNSRFRYQVGTGISINRQQNINKTFNNANIEQKTINIFPRASFLYSVSKQQSIRLTYNGRSRQPGINELQPVPDFSNPLLIHIGNPFLKPEFNNEITAGYNRFNAKKISNIALQVSYRNTLNRIANSIVTNAQGIQEQQYVNMNGDYGIGGAVSYDIQLIKPQKPFNLRYGTSFSFNRDANLVNNVLNIRNSTSLSKRLVLYYRIGDKLFASATGNFNLNRTKYSIQTTGTNTFISHQYSGNFSYEFPAQWVVYTDFSLFFNNTPQQSKAPKSAVWNASILKRMLKDRKGELRLSILDILNDKKDFNQNIGNNYIEMTKSEVIKRIFNLSFIYRFRGNKL